MNVLLLATACSAKPPAAEPAPVGTLGVTERAAHRTRIASLDDVAVGREADRERIAFKMSQMPGYRVQYVETATHCGSGEPIDLPGAAMLEITLRPAAAHTDDGQLTVPFTDKTFDQPLIKAVRSSCDFEANVVWLVGLDSKVPYRVIESTAPLRLVIELLP